MIPPESGPLTTIDQGAIYPAHSAVGWANLVISNPALSGSQDEVIRSWEPDRPSRTIVAQADTDVPAVALSDSSMVWVGVHGPARWDGTFTAAELYWTSFPAGQDSVSIGAGISLAGTHGFTELQTWGDYAATIGEADGDANSTLFVVRLSDGHTWSVHSRPGSVFVRLLAVSQKEIVVGEDTEVRYQMHNVTRYQLARLDELAAAW
jgi:hypothetical protein